MPKIIIDNFAAGIRASTGYTTLKNVSASEIINFDVDKLGRLVKRLGSKHMNSSKALPGIPVSLFRAYKPEKNYPLSKAFLIVSVKDEHGLWYWDSTLKEFKELKNSSDDSFVSLAGIEVYEKFDYAQMSGRLFMGLGYSGWQFWCDLSGSAPVLYDHGITRPSSAPTATATTGGSLTTDSYYAYAVTFYRGSEVIESRPSDRVVVYLDPASGHNAVDLSDIPTSSDNQVTARRIYRTKACSSATEAQTATLYYLYTISDNTTDTYSDTAADSALGNEIECLDHDPPPQYHYVCNHAGRLWIADDDDDYLYFSKIDKLGAPVPDAFPVENVGTDLLPYVVRVGGEEGDPITGLWRSPAGRQLVVFKRNSITLVYGNDPYTLDVSHVIDETGCPAPWSIASVGGALLFLGSDKRIWAFTGLSLKPISTDVDPILEQIPDSRIDQCVGGVHMGRYYLAFPTTDGYNDRVLVFDTDQKYWTMYNLHVNDFSWWRGKEPSEADRNRFVIARSDMGYVDYLFTDEDGDDITDDNGVAIRCSWQSNWIEFPTSTSVITAVYIYPVTTGTSFTVTVERYDGSFDQYTYTPAPSNMYRQGFYSQGRLQRVKIEANDPPPIERIEIEYVVK